MAASMRDLKVWQEAVALAAEVVRAVRSGRTQSVEVLTDDLIRTSLSAAAAVGDGWSRREASEQKDVYVFAKRELLRLETLLAVARQADFISTATHADLSARIQTALRLLGGYLVYLERAPGSAAFASAAGDAAAERGGKGS